MSGLADFTLDPEHQRLGQRQGPGSRRLGTLSALTRKAWADLGNPKHCPGGWNRRQTTLVKAHAKSGHPLARQGQPARPCRLNWSTWTQDKTRTDSGDPRQGPARPGGLIQPTQTRYKALWVDSGDCQCYPRQGPD